MTAKASARLVGSAAEIGAARWNALANPEGLAEPHPFTTYEFFAALEESGGACILLKGHALEYLNLDTGQTLQ